jgi:DNA-binding CsgD family transcriptional regulator
LITLGYVKTSFRLTARQNYTALALNGKQNREFQEELCNAYQSENLMQVMFCEDHCNAREYRHVGEGLLPVEKNRPRSFTKVASQLVERGLLVQNYSMVEIARGEGIAEALIEIRNR